MDIVTEQEQPQALFIVASFVVMDRIDEICLETGFTRDEVKDLLRPFMYGDCMVDIMDYTRAHRITDPNSPKNFSREFIVAMMASGFQPDDGCLLPDWCPPLHKEDL